MEKRTPEQKAIDFATAYSADNPDLARRVATKSLEQAAKDHPAPAESKPGETRQQRRARERAEAKAAARKPQKRPRYRTGGGF